jgi:hypothetical protein
MDIPQGQPIFNNHVALILDGKVQTLMQLDDILAAILLSDPIIVDVTGPDGRPTISPGTLYNSETGEFSQPENIHYHEDGSDEIVWIEE